MNEWVKVNRHLQSVGTATCDVSNLILQADDCEREGNGRVAFMLMTAARDLLRARSAERRAYSHLLNRKHKPVYAQRGRG